ncbi:MAG: hypothetical protein DI527_23810, partial [Chelatococcus sp.]
MGLSMKTLLSLRLPIATRLAIVGVLIVAVAVGASVWLSITEARDAMRERAQASLVVNINMLRDILGAKGEPRLDGERLLYGSDVINGDFTAVDKVKALAGSTATVFMGDIRVATNVQKPDGSRAVGTKLAPGPAYDAVFKQKTRYSGTADILGESYFTIYEPIVQKADGKVIGVLYVGVKQAEFMSVIREMVVWNTLAGLLTAAVAGLALFLLVRRMLAPLDAMKQALDRLATGDHETPVPVFRAGSEFAAMGQGVEVLRRASLEKVRLESEAAAQSGIVEQTRRMTEAEREEAANRQAEQARDLKTVMDAVAEGLGELAGGNFAHRITVAMPAGYAKLRADFNETVERLSATVRTIQSTSSDVGTAAR